MPSYKRTYEPPAACRQHLANPAHKPALQLSLTRQTLLQRNRADQAVSKTQIPRATAAEHCDPNLGVHKQLCSSVKFTGSSGGAA
jgi:hypothetical protein